MGTKVERPRSSLCAPADALASFHHLVVTLDLVDDDKPWHEMYDLESDDAGVALLVLTWTALLAASERTKISTPFLARSLLEDLRSEKLHNTKQFIFQMLEAVAIARVDSSNGANERANRILCTQAMLLFHHADRRGILPKTTQAVGDWLGDWLARKMPDDPVSAVTAGAYMDWSLRKRGVAYPEYAQSAIAALANRHWDTDSQVGVIRALMWLPSEIIGTDGAGLARRGLSILPQCMQEDDEITRLSLLVRLVADNPIDARKYKPDILDACVKFARATEVNRHYLNLSVVAEREDYEDGGAHLLAPAIGAYARYGDSKSSFECVAALRGIDELAMSETPILLFSGESTGLVLATSTRLITLQTDVGLTELTRSVTNFLGLRGRNAGDPEAEIPEPERVGRIFAAAGKNFEKELERYAPFDAVADELKECTETHGSLLPVAPTILPFQAHMVKQIGFTFPITISLKEPYPDRPLRTALIWCRGSQFDEVEIEVLRSAFEAMQLDVVLPEEHTLEEFVSLYNGPAVDLVWIGGHASYENEEQSTLPICTNGVVTPDVLSREGVNDRERRLLVLNACETGRLDVKFGVVRPRSGLGISAAHPTQAVVSHLWPLPGVPDAVAFALLMSASMSKNATTGRGVYFEWFADALSALVKGRQGAAAKIRGRAGYQRLNSQTRKAVDRWLEDDPLSADRWPDPIASWASPVFYQ